MCVCSYDYKIKNKNMKGPLTLADLSLSRLHGKWILKMTSGGRVRLCLMSSSRSSYICTYTHTHTHTHTSMIIIIHLSLIIVHRLCLMSSSRSSSASAVENR